ncbi:hypothetical protein OXX69_006122 [Metschnikowia pulcherrima]
MEGRQSNTQRVQPVADPSFSVPGSYAEPYLQDDFNFANLAIITNFETQAWAQLIHCSLIMCRCSLMQQNFIES